MKEGRSPTNSTEFQVAAVSVLALSRSEAESDLVLLQILTCYVQISYRSLSCYSHPPNKPVKAGRFVTIQGQL